ncbi:hypothetical protein DESA109040_17535 [Deinococcus saxicola]
MEDSALSRMNLRPLELGSDAPGYATVSSVTRSSSA